MFARTMCQSKFLIEVSRILHFPVPASFRLSRELFISEFDALLTPSCHVICFAMLFQLLASFLPGWAAYPTTEPPSFIQARDWHDKVIRPVVVVEINEEVRSRTGMDTSEKKHTKNGKFV
jgi:hypothetical protein